MTCRPGASWIGISNRHFMNFRPHSQGFPVVDNISTICRGMLMMSGNASHLSRHLCCAPTGPWSINRVPAADIRASKPRQHIRHPTVQRTVNTRPLERLVPCMAEYAKCIFEKPAVQLLQSDCYAGSMLRACWIQWMRTFSAVSRRIFLEMNLPGDAASHAASMMDQFLVGFCVCYFCLSGGH
jgi:hypothetical protein